MYCKECGSEIIDGKFCSECGTPINTEQNVHQDEKDKVSNWGYLNSNNFNKWAQGIGTSLIIWGVLNLFWAPIFGVLLLFFGILIYILKSSTIVTVFGSIWLLVALYQLYIGLFLIASYTILAIINGLFSIYLLYKVNKFQKGE